MTSAEPVIAEFTLSAPEFDTFADLAPSLELRMVDYYSDSDGIDHAIFWAIGDPADDLERALSESRVIRSWTRLVALQDRSLYDFVVGRASDLATVVEASHRCDLVWQGLRVSHGRLLVRTIVSDRADLRSFEEAIAERGIGFDLVRVISEVEPRISDGPSLTRYQREAILLAYEEGYFEEPRGITLAELGETLGISESAVAGRLRRGLGNLIADALEVDDTTGGPSPRGT